MSISASHPKTMAAIAAVAALFLGIGVGWYVAARTYGELLARGATANVESQVTWNSVVLERLARGDSGGAQRLVNTWLDTDLYVLETFRETGTQISPGMSKTLKRISDVRTASGYEPKDPNTKDAVAKLFADLGAEER